MPRYHDHILSSVSMPGLTFPLIGHHGKSSKSNTSTSTHRSVDVDRGEIKPMKRRSNGKITSNRSSTTFRNYADPHLSMTIESPPLVCYGPAKESSGALLSGLLHLTVEAEEQKFDSFILTLTQSILKKRAVYGHSGCSECARTTETLNTWRFFTSPVPLTKGVHTYPFSFLFPGHLPATTDNCLARISYTLSASATTTEGDEINFKKPIKLSRAILPGPDKHSIRIFPPTNLSASIVLPSVVHPGGDFNFDIRLDGVLNRQKNTRWRLRKTSWRVEEHSRTISDVCAHRATKVLETVIEHEDVRIIGSGEMKRGWKHDFDTADGKFEVTVDANIPTYAEACCKLEPSNGVSVNHILIVEMIVAEEYASGAYQRGGSTPTGSARVLRMQFHLTVTSRSGLGISWDEEAPPMYEDVPIAPPEYERVVEGETVFRYACFERWGEYERHDGEGEVRAESSSSLSIPSTPGAASWSITELEEGP